jgi:hypothetical protein
MDARAASDRMPKFLQPMQGTVLFGRGLCNALYLLNSVLAREHYDSFDDMLRAFPGLTKQTHRGEINLAEQFTGKSEQELVASAGPQILMLEAYLIGWSEKEQKMVLADVKSTNDFQPVYLIPAQGTRQIFCGQDAPWHEYNAERGDPRTTADFVDLMRCSYRWVEKNMPGSLNLCGGRILSCRIRPDGSMVQSSVGKMVEASQPAAPVGKVGRNEPCPCGSGKKYKRCCGR